MSDITLPLPGNSIGWKASSFHLSAILMLLASLLIALNWSLARTSERECDVRRGGFNSGFSSGFQTYSCECSSLVHFAEACPTPATVLAPDFAPAL